MNLYLNELSLHNQYQTVSDFLTALQTVLNCRRLMQQYGFRLYCRREMSQQPTLNGQPFQAALFQTKNRDLVRVVQSWLTKEGPFMDAERVHLPDDYLYLKYNEEIVTDYSLGEAAYRVATQQPSSTVSFAPSEFMHDPINVVWLRDDEAARTIPVRNFWEAASLENHLKQTRQPVQSWADLLDRVATDFPHLIVLDSVRDVLAREAFNQTIADTTLVQLDILNRFATCFDEKGERTPDGYDLYQKHFQRKEGAFSDESESNKVKFQQALTFTLPDGSPIFCPYHGKMKYRLYRIHFSWPIRYQEPIYIAYIGPKITKG